MRRSANTAPPSGSSRTTPMPTMISPGPWSRNPIAVLESRARRWSTLARRLRSAPRRAASRTRWPWPSTASGTGPSRSPPPSGRSHLTKGVDATNWFFLAMALWQQGDKDRSRAFFDQAVSWTKENHPENADLPAIWREAAVLLGQPGPDAPALLPDLPTDPCALRSAAGPATFQDSREETCRLHRISYPPHQLVAARGPHR